jgi:hypothetical protein
MAGMGSIVDIVMILIIGYVAIQVLPSVIDALKKIGSGGAEDANTQDQNAPADNNILAPIPVPVVNPPVRAPTLVAVPPIAISSRFGRGATVQQRLAARPGGLPTPARGTCACNGRVCCFNGNKCNGLPSRECANAAADNASSRNTACRQLRTFFLSKNRCVVANAGFAYGDHGETISLDAMAVTIA